MKTDIAITCITVTVCTALVVPLLSGCAYSRPSSHADYMNIANWSVVAGVNGTDRRLQALVRSVLKEKGIDCFMEGSVGYDVWVHRDRATEARKVLRSDPRLKSERVFMILPLETPVN